MEKEAVSLDGLDGAAGTFECKDVLKLDGPRPENIPLNKFLTDTTVQKLDDSPFKCHIITVSRKKP